MALTQSQVSALYIALLGRASEGEGSKYWLNTSKSANLSMADVARFIMNDKEAKANFATHFETPEKLVDFIYANAFGKGAGVDQEGKAFWINHLKNGVDQATIVSEILKGALAEKYAKSTDTTIKNDFSLFINKIAASNMVSESVEKLPEGGLKALQEINKAVKPATKVAEVKNLITANETLKSAVDTTKLEKAATANDPAKVIANVTGAKVEEITKILKENPVVSTDGSGDSNAGADSNAGSNVNNGIDEIIVPAPGSGSGGSETPTVTIAQADLANTAATNLKIEDSAAHIQGALADLVTHVAKVASINANDNGSEIAMTKAQFDALKDKLDAGDTIKVTDLAAGDVETAKNAKVDSFTMNGGVKLTVGAENVATLAAKAAADVLAVADTAENIKNALDNLVTNVDKVASINASDDGSEIEMDKTQFDALKDKLDAGDTIKVTDLAAGDMAIAENAKVDSFTIFEANASTLNDAALTRLVAIKDKVAEINTDNNAAITLSVDQFKALGAKFKTDENLTINEATGTLEATGATDIFKLKAGESALKITGFAAADKIDVTALIAGQNTFAEDTVTANKVADGKFYVVDGSSIAAITATSVIGTDFGALFGNDKTFKATGGADAEARAIVAVKLSGDAGYKLYAINNAAGSGVNDIAQSEVTIVGTVAGTFDSNIADNFVLAGA